MPRLQRPGFSLHYQVVEGVLPRDTLFLHGNLASNLWWEPAVEVWKSSSKNQPGRAILAEWRGCGGSATFEGAFDLPTLAADCNSLLEALSARKVDLVAHSTGGLIGLHAIAANPSRFGRAVLLDTVAPEGIALAPEMIEAFAQMSRDRSFCAAVILSTIHEATLSESFRGRIVDAAFGVNPRIWKEVPSLISSPPAIDLSHLNLPVLVAHGELDVVLPLEASKALAKALPEGRLEILKGRGHCPNVEDPAAFVAMVDNFLRS